MHSELAEQTAVKRFIFEAYNKGLADSRPDYSALDSPVFDGKKRGEIDVREAVKGLFSAYHTWEAQTLKEYTAAANHLLEAGDVAGYVRVRNYRRCAERACYPAQ